MKYKVNITERYFVCVEYEVEADNEDDACDIARDYEEHISIDDDVCRMVDRTGFEFDDREVMRVSLGVHPFTELEI